MHAENFQRRMDTLEGWPVRLTSYKLQHRFICKVDNVEPGALIARAEGSTSEEAEKVAVDKARHRLAQTRRHVVPGR